MRKEQLKNMSIILAELWNLSELAMSELTPGAESNLQSKSSIPGYFCTPSPKPIL